MTIEALLLSAGILGAVGLGFAVLISVANRRFYVFEDPRIDAVVSLLPGNNCGACGFPGCRGFGEALVGGTTKPAICTVMSTDAREDVAAFLGIDVGSADQRVARLLCAGGRDVAVQEADYVGLETCAAATAVASGGKGCTWGCLGLADCERSCDFGAIGMNDVGLPVVEPSLCTACGDCVEACPKDLFVLMPLAHQLLVQCRNLLDGDAATAVCQVACNGCRRCAADAALDLITIQSGLAIVDYDRYDLATPDAIARCPTGAIVWINGAQFQEPARVLQGAVS